MNETYFKGLNEYEEGTFGCRGYNGCLYKQNGRCIYNIAPIQQRSSRACYHDELQADIEARHDYEDGLY